MAAPKEKNIGDLNGVWVINSELSDTTDEIFKLQEMPYATRTVIGYSTVTLTLTQSLGKPAAPAPENAPEVTQVVIEQHLAPVRFMPSIKGTRENRCLDGLTRSHEDHIFGKVEGYSKFLERSEINDVDLEKNWAPEDEERAGPENKAHILSFVRNLDEGKGWEATQIWGFQIVDGQRRYCRNIRVTKPGAQTLYARLVYDYKATE
ncbi:hypothetical protein CFIMG_003905RA [Ceratocystis fimbriata CBS 114723]|uniref:Uncharacterized protein n=1 Tax=Ceratocystis fimbriata CBS 114723 TaxID=1035309 RepID=A0A2C5XAQ1_9PEZI|nr:hypothetical protein CFIMG_003905RA [Ceratocystis fimbriata CBS 114723]